MRLAAAFTLAFLAALGPNASAADFSQANLSPYVTIHTRSASVESERPTVLTFRETNQYVTQGGAYFFTSASRAGTDLPQSSIFSGLATPAQLNELRARLNTHNIRGRRSCEQIIIPDVSIVHEVVWYSIHGRRNAFTVVISGETTGLPECPLGLLEAMFAVANFGVQVRGNPDTEILAP
jgi:hypothetical protein